MAGTRKPNIQLTSQLKSTLDGLKKTPNESYNDVVARSLYSSVPSAALTVAPSVSVGVSSGEEAYNTYSHIMGWIKDTQKKMPFGGDYEITPDQRETAYNIDPLVSGIISPFLKNIILNAYILETKDNDKYTAMIDEINEFLEEINLMQVFRDDFEDYAIKHGHSYRRKDEIDGQLWLERLEARAMKTYTDPWHSYLVSYHQRIYAANKFSSNLNSITQETNSWFIPGGLKIIQSENIEEEGANVVWEQFARRYGVDEIGGLRVGDSADIIAMHKVRPGKPAPIDSAIQAIWEKRALIANIPNLIYAVLYPFIHIKKGVMLETTDANGQKQLITSVPQRPPTEMATTDPERYNNQDALYKAFTDALTNDVNNIVRYRAEGGAQATGPDTEIKVIESASSIAPSFITAVLGHFNADIGEALGFPYALIIARGGFGTTDDPILRLVKTAYAGSYFEYEKVAMDLIREKFAGKSWDYEIELRDDKKETGTFTFEETGLEFKLGEGDPKDALKEAQTELINFQTAQIAKAMGASASDIKSFLDEKEQGLWEFDNFDVQPPSPFGQFPVQQQDKEGHESDGKEPAKDAEEMPTKAGMEEINSAKVDWTMKYENSLSSEEYIEIKRVFGKIKCSIGKDKDGYFAYTHRARSESYPTIAEIPKSKLEFIETTSILKPTPEEQQLAKDLMATYAEAQKAIDEILKEK